MSIFSNIVKKAAPFVAAAAPGTPIGAAAAVKTVADQQAQQTFLIETAREQQRQRQRNIEMEYFGNGSSIPTMQANFARTTPVVSTASSGGGFLDTITSGLKSVGGFVSDVFNTGVPQILGVARPPSVRQQPALTTITNVGAQESQGSGSIQAGAGALIPQVIGAARNLLKTPGGQLALGGGAGFIGSMVGSSGTSPRITRKMKSQARMVLNMTGGNLSATADVLGIDQNTLVMILLKRFRNDGPVVTKAALRKTKQTIRRLHNMQDVLKSITPTATMRRRTPMKRATTTTLIKN